MSTVRSRTETTPRRSRLRDGPRQWCGRRRRFSYYRYRESRQTPLTPRKQLREALSRQLFHFRRATKHRVLDRSADPHRRIHQRRDAVLHRFHRHQRSSMEHEEIPLTPSTRCQKRARSVTSTSQAGFASPERGDQVVRLREPTVSIRRVATESKSRRKCHVSFENTAATAAVQHRKRADGWSLRLRPTLSPQGVGRGGVRADKPNGGKNNHRRTQARATTYTATQTTHARAGGLMFPSSCLGGGITRVGPCQYPQYNRADFGPEAVGSSYTKHHKSPNVKPHEKLKSRKWKNKI